MKNFHLIASWKIFTTLYLGLWLSFIRADWLWLGLTKKISNIRGGPPLYVKFCGIKNFLRHLIWGIFKSLMHAPCSTPNPSPTIYPRHPAPPLRARAARPARTRIMDVVANCGAGGSISRGRKRDFRLRPYQVENTVSRPINVSQAT